MNQAPRKRPHVVQLIGAGIIFAVLALITCVLVNGLTGNRFFQLAQAMNAWLLNLIGIPFNVWFHQPMLALQIAGTGFVVGAALSWYLPQDRSDK